jgi:hypothetical protein
MAAVEPDRRPPAVVGRLEVVGRADDRVGLHRVVEVVVPDERPAVEPVGLDVGVLGKELAVEILARKRPAVGDGEHAPLGGAELFGFEEVHISLRSP